MKQNGRFNFFIKCAILIFFVFCAVTVVQLKFEYNELERQKEELNGQIEACLDEIEKTENELNADFDDEYIARVAREKLNYCLPEEIVFYSDR